MKTRCGTNRPNCATATRKCVPRVKPKGRFVPKGSQTPGKLSTEGDTMAIAYTPEVRDDLLNFVLGMSRSGYFSQQSVHLAVYLLDQFFEVGAVGVASVLYVPTVLLWSTSMFLGLSENALNATEMISEANKHAK
eukprot:635371-Rhodomonas_salina.1